MKKLNNPTENFVSKRINQRRVRRWVALLSALVLFLTVNTLKLEADTLERIATCGIEQHVHDESCYDASGALICGLAEHAHTDACFQQRPQRHDLTRVDGFMPLNAKVTLATPMPRLTSNSANGQDAEQVDIDYYSDIPTEVGSGIEPPVDEIQTELAGEEAAPAVEDAVPLEIVYEDQVEETVQQPEYVINGSTVLLSDILSVLGMKVSGIHSAGELEGDTLAETPVNFAVEATQNDYELRVLRDFDAADLAVMTDDEVIIITLKNGIAPVEDNDDENPSENDDINIEETHTGETDDEAAAEETVDEETEDSADEATVDELTEDTDDAETEETADETTVDATEEETVETVEETETAAVVPDKLVALDFADYDCLADATVYFYAPDRGAVLVNAEELAEADGVHLTVNAPVVLSMEADLGLAELEAALEEAPEDIDVRIGENPVLFENGVLIISGDGELTVNGVTYSVTNVTLPSRSVESDNIIISTVDDQATLLGVTPAFEDNGEDEGDIYALFAAQMDENIVTATSEEIQIDAIEPAKGLLRSSAMMAAEDAAPEAEEAVADAEETVEETAETETAEAAVETRTLKVRVYDVSLIREGEFVEPDAPIHVETTFDAPLEGENFQLYHIVDGKPEAVDGFVKTDDQGRAIGMSFDTASLSPFAVVYYTVEYTTTDNVIEVKVDFTDIVKNGVDFDAQTVISALNDGVGIKIDELEKGYASEGDGVVYGELYVDYTTADNKNENIKNVNWIGFNAVSADEGLTVADGNIRVTRDGTVTLSDGISTINIVISGYQNTIQKVLGDGATIEALNGELPMGASAEYKDLSDKADELAETYNLKEETENAEVGFSAFDVSVTTPDGEMDVNGQFAVTVEHNVQIPEGAKVELFHIHDGAAELVEGAKVEDGKVTFVTNGFSEYVIRYTVDFEFNGYEFSMAGGSGLYLSVLADALNIYDIEGGFALEDVIDVSFSNPELMTAQQVTTDDDSVDWLLRSIAPFTTEETLTLFMRDGRRIAINATDDLLLSDFVSDAHITIDGTTYGIGQTWPVRPDVDYDMVVRFSENGTKQLPKGGNEMVMDLPAGITIADTDGHKSFDIPVGVAGTITGNEYWIEGNKLHIRFGPDPEDLLTRSSDIYMDLTLKASFDKNVKEIEFNSNAKLEFDVNTDGDLTLKKTGSYNPETNKMEYTLTVNSVGNTTDIVLSDHIAQAGLLTIDEGSFVIEPNNPSLIPSVASDHLGFDLTIPSMTHGQTITVKYTASVNVSGVNTDGTIKVSDTGKNTLGASYDGPEHKTESTDFVYNNTIQYSSIAKSNTGIVDSEDSATLNWTIVANANQRGSIAGGTITDTIDYSSKDAMKYVKVSGGENDGKVALNIVVKNGDTKVTSYTAYVDVSEVSGNEGRETWTYNIPNDANGNYTYEISYDTIVTKSAMDQNSNGFVKNKTENHQDNSDEGSGVVPGITGGGGGENNPYTAGKTAKTVTPEYIDWDIVVVVPPEGYNEKFEIVDYVPSLVDYGYADTFEKIVGVTGLTNNESYGEPVVTHGGNDKVQTDIVTISFYKDQAKTNPGLEGSGSNRTLTITIRTRNQAAWIIDAESREGGDPRYNHTNNFAINNVTQSGVSAKPLHTSIDKQFSVESTDSTTKTPVYAYRLVLTNVVKEPIVIVDTFDTNVLEYVGLGNGTWDATNYIAYAESKNNLNGGVAGNGQASITPNGTGITITANSLPKKADGSFYEYYEIYYRLRVKSEAVETLKALALANGGETTIGNSASWSGKTDDVDVTYKVPVLEKEGSFAVAQDAVGGNKRIFNYVIDINPSCERLNGGTPMNLSDTHTDNLSVDYTTVKVYTVDSNGVETLDNSIKWNFNGNIGSFPGLQDATHYRIKYSCLVIGNGTQHFTNEVNMHGFHSEKTESRTFSDSITAGGTVCEINLIKHKDGQTSEGLEGATFQLFYESNGRWIPMKYGRGTGAEPNPKEGQNVTFTTDSVGHVLIALNQSTDGNELRTGVHYGLKEIETPPGYMLRADSPEYWEFTLTQASDDVNYGGIVNGKRQWIYYYYGDNLKMANNPAEEPLDVKVDKKWFASDGTELDMEDPQNHDLTAKVQLYRKKNAEPYKKVSVTVGSSGDTVQIIELEDSSTEGEVTLDKDNKWTYTWNDLPRNDGDNKYAYKVEELSVEGYSTTVVEKEVDDLKTYTYKNRKADVANENILVKKQWINKDGETQITPSDEAWADLPDDIEFTLYQAKSYEPFEERAINGGTAYTAIGCDAYKNGSNDGAYKIKKAQYTDGITLKNLPTVVIEDGTGRPVYYSYYIKENVSMRVGADTIGKLYYTDVEGETIGGVYTFTMVNTRKPEPENTDLDVTKVWKDKSGNVISAPSATVTYKLYQVTSDKPFKEQPKSGGTLFWYTDEWNNKQNGQSEEGLFTLPYNSAWTMNFKGLPAITMDANDVATYYAYYVDEVAVDKYDTTYDYSYDAVEKKLTVSIVNQQVDTDLTSISVRKEWYDGENEIEDATLKDGLKATVQLVRYRAVQTGMTIHFMNEDGDEITSIVVPKGKRTVKFHVDSIEGGNGTNYATSSSVEKIISSGVSGDHSINAYSGTSYDVNLTLGEDYQNLTDLWMINRYGNITRLSVSTEEIVPVSTPEIDTSFTTVLTATLDKYNNWTDTTTFKKLKKTEIVGGVPYVYTYGVREVSCSDGFEFKAYENGSFVADTSTPKASNPGIDIVVKNKKTAPQTGELQVSKTVVSGDTAENFTFTITLTNANGLPAVVPVEIVKKSDNSQVTPEANYTVTDNKLTVVLKHDQKALIKKLPVGTTYSIVETSVPGYTLSWSSTNGSSGNISTTPSNADATNTFTSAEYTPLVNKVLNGAAFNGKLGDGTTAASFTFDLKAMTVDGETYTVADTALQRKSTGTDGTVTFEAIKYNAPGTYYYEISEQGTDTATMDYDEKKVYLKVVVADNLTVAGTYWLDQACTVSTAGDGATFENTELTTIDAEKNWANESLSNGDQVTFKLYADGVEQNGKSVTLNGKKDLAAVPESPATLAEDEEVNAETITANAYEYDAWKAKWTNLPKYKVKTVNEVEKVVLIDYTVQESQFIYGGVTYNTTQSGTTYTAAKDNTTVETGETVHTFWRIDQNGNVITNDVNETHIEVTKKWIGVGMTDWPQTSGGTYIPITLTLRKRTGANEHDADVATVDVTPTSTSQTITGLDGAKVTVAIKENDGYKITISGLQKNGSVTTSTNDTVTGELEWYVKETQVEGYGVPKYTIGTSTDTRNDGAHNSDVITNEIVTFELPSTGGPGTTGFYVLGSILTLLAAVLLITKKRTDGQGIE